MKIICNEVLYKKTKLTSTMRSFFGVGNAGQNKSKTYVCKVYLKHSLGCIIRKTNKTNLIYPDPVIPDFTEPRQLQYIS